MKATYPVNENDKAEFIGQILDVFEDFLDEKEITIPGNDQLMREAGCSEEEIEENETVLYGENYHGIYEDIERLLENWNIIEKPSNNRKEEPSP